MIKALIFDMDGVLLNTETVNEKATVQMMKGRYGVDLPLEVILKTMGLRDKEEFAMYKALYGIKDPIEKMVDYRNNRFYELANESNVVFKGVNEKLKELSNKYTLALTTSAHGVKFNFETKFFNIGLFEIIIQGSDVKKGKPNPECYLTTINRLGLQPYECVVVEDSLNGIRAAKKAGAKCIAVLGTFSEAELKKAGADVIIPGVNYITKEILGAMK